VKKRSPILNLKRMVTMTSEKIKPVVISITIILSLWLLAILIFILYPLGFLMIIPLGFLSIAIIHRKRIAWWIGAIVFGLLGVFNVLWLIAVDLNVILDVISGSSQFRLHPVGIIATLLRIITVFLVVLYFMPGVRRYCLEKANLTDT